MKKRSATKKTPAHPRPLDEDLVFLLDENLDSRTIAADLRAAGYVIRQFHEEFDRGTADEEWLPYAGARGWVVLSVDARIRREPNEREAARRSGVRLFVLTSVNLRAYEIAAVFIRHRKRIEHIARDVAAPFVARVNRTEVEVIEQGRLAERRDLDDDESCHDDDE